MDINIIFAKVLKELRKKKGLTQEELAEISNIDYKYLQKLESSKPSSPTLKVIEKLAHALNISITDFINSIEKYK